MLRRAFPPAPLPVVPHLFCNPSRLPHSHHQFDVGPIFRTRLGLLAAFIALVIVNAGAGGRNRATSDLYYTPITPSGWTFAVWGLIFFLQAVGTVWAAIPYGYGLDNGTLTREPGKSGLTPQTFSIFLTLPTRSLILQTHAGLKERVVSAVAFPWTLGWLFQILWQFSFLARTKVGMWFGLAFLIAAFVSMAWAVLRLKTRFTPVPRSWHGALTHWAYFVPSSINAAWLSAATIVGAIVVGVAHNASVTPLRWIGIALVALITLLSLCVAGWKPDIAWPATLVWALAGVFSAHRGDTAVAIASMVCLVINALAAIGASGLVLRGRQAAAAARAGAPGAAPAAAAAPAGAV